MSEVYYALIILPTIILALLLFVFQSSITAIEQNQTIMNCPFPINAGIGNLTAFQNPPQINYTQTFDTDSDDYHVTTFECEFDPTSESASINTRIYTADTTNDWFAMTNRASGYLFYIGEVIDTVGIRLNAFGNLLWLNLTAPAQVTGLDWFNYVELILVTFIGLGVFMIARG